jgi:hypothetical protein
MSELQEQTYKYPHVVKAAMDSEVATESGAWRLADALYEDITEVMGVAAATPSTGVNTGLFTVLEEARLEAKRAGVHDLAFNTCRNYFQTARAWPPETRVSQASFTAHERIKSRPDRQQRLNELVRQSSRGWVGDKEVRLWKQGLKPTEVVPFLDQIEKRVRNALRPRVVWNRLGDDDRVAIAQMLRKFAFEIETKGEGWR